MSNISASWYPFAEVAGPTVLQKEKFEPFFTIVSFSFDVVMAILFCLAESLLYIFVVNDAIASSLGGSTIGCSAGTCVTLGFTLFWLLLTVLFPAILFWVEFKVLVLIDVLFCSSFVEVLLAEYFVVVSLFLF